MKIFVALSRMRCLYIRGIIFVIFNLALYSCSSLKNISIEVAVLPEFPISEDVQSIALLNRSMNLQFTNSKSDSIEKILIGKKMLMDTVFRDSIVADTAIQVAAKALFESGRFDVVVPKVRNILRNDNNEIGEPLNFNFINGICKDFNVDALLILENFSENLSTKYYLIRDEGTYYGGQEFNATTDVESRSEWRLYRPVEGKLALRFQLRDSIFWDISRYTIKDLYSQMPRTKEALIGGGIAAGLKISRLIGQNWITQTRYYFMTGNPDIDAAVPLIMENKWEEAAAIWTKYATVESKRVRGKVEFNLALASEMSGNLDLAIEWGLKSFKTKYSKAIEVYLKNLDTKRSAKLKESKLRY
jgi:hypothetical protein